MDIKIRSWKSEDAKALARALNNKKVLDNLRDGIPFPYTESDANDFISNMIAADKNKTFAWAITADDITIGSIGVFRGENVHRLTAEMGYYIAEGYWGRGIATEAIRQASDYIFENTDIIRIYADPYEFNSASCRALEKAGFKYEGTLRKNAIKNGCVIDMKMYALVKD